MPNSSPKHILDPYALKQIPIRTSSSPHGSHSSLNATTSILPPPAATNSADGQQHATSSTHSLYGSKKDLLIMTGKVDSVNATSSPRSSHEALDRNDLVNEPKLKQAGSASSLNKLTSANTRASLVVGGGNSSLHSAVNDGSVLHTSHSQKKAGPFAFFLRKETSTTSSASSLEQQQQSHPPDKEHQTAPVSTGFDAAKRLLNLKKKNKSLEFSEELKFTKECFLRLLTAPESDVFRVFVEAKLGSYATFFKACYQLEALLERPTEELNSIEEGLFLIDPPTATVPTSPNPDATTDSLHFLSFLQHDPPHPLVSLFTKFHSEPALASLAAELKEPEWLLHVPDWLSHQCLLMYAKYVYPREQTDDLNPPIPKEIKRMSAQGLVKLLDCSDLKNSCVHRFAFYAPILYLLQFMYSNWFAEFLRNKCGMSISVPLEDTPCLGLQDLNISDEPSSLDTTSLTLYTDVSGQIPMSPTPLSPGGLPSVSGRMSRTSQSESMASGGSSNTAGNKPKLLFGKKPKFFTFGGGQTSQAALSTDTTKGKVPGPSEYRNKKIEPTHEALVSVLNDPVLYEQFMSIVQGMHCTENLIFYESFCRLEKRIRGENLILNIFRHNETTLPPPTKTSIEWIPLIYLFYFMFIRPGSEFEINLPSSLRKKVNARLSDLSVFDECMMHVLELLYSNTFQHYVKYHNEDVKSF